MPAYRSRKQYLGAMSWGWGIRQWSNNPHTVSCIFRKNKQQTWNSLQSFGTCYCHKHHHRLGNGSVSQGSEARLRLSDWCRTIASSGEKLTFWNMSLNDFENDNLNETRRGKCQAQVNTVCVTQAKLAATVFQPVLLDTEWGYLESPMSDILSIWFITGIVLQLYFRAAWRLLIWHPFGAVVNPPGNTYCSTDSSIYMCMMYCLGWKFSFLSEKQ